MEIHVAENLQGCRKVFLESVQKPIEVHISIDANPFDCADARITDDYRVKTASWEIVFSRESLFDSVG